MKKIFIFFIVALLSLESLELKAQNHNPYLKENSAAKSAMNKTNALTTTHEIQNPSTKDSLFYFFSKIDSINNKKKINDSLTYFADKIQNIFLDSSHTENPFSLIGNIGASNLTANNLQQTIANLSIGARIRIGNIYLANNHKYINTWYVYAMWNTKIATSPDSSVIQKNILFPEIGKRDFVIGIDFRKTNIHFNWDWIPFVEFALNTYTDTTLSSKKIDTNYNFKTGSIQIGCHLVKYFSFPLLDKPQNGSFSITPYYHLISIDPKYWQGYNNLTKEVNAYPTIHALGLNTNLQVGSVAVFCNTKYIINKSSEDISSQNYIKSPDFKRFVYIIGTTIIF